MKTFSKIAMVVGALAVGGAANAAVVSNEGYSGASSLVLLVADATGGKYYTQDLGVSLDAILTASQNSTGAQNKDTANGGTNVEGVISASALNGIATSPNLTSFITAAGSDPLKWTILATNQSGSGDALGTDGRLFAATSTTNNFFTQQVGSGDIFASSAAVSDLFNAVNNDLTNTNGSSAAVGYGKGTAGLGAPNSWITSTFANGAAIGTAQKLYVVGTSGLNDGDVWQSTETLTLSALGVLTVSSTSSVPVPAAFYLFGSGLMGLLGFGRRRNLTAVA